jgi:hypothetical protein
VSSDNANSGDRIGFRPTAHRFSLFSSPLSQALFSLPLFAARFADESLLRALPADQVRSTAAKP